jgi:hypothetical protein
MLHLAHTITPMNQISGSAFAPPLFSFVVAELPQSFAFVASSETIAFRVGMIVIPAFAGRNLIRRAGFSARLAGEQSIFIESWIIYELRMR